jgi:hypothetical protein
MTTISLSIPNENIWLRLDSFIFRWSTSTYLQRRKQHYALLAVVGPKYTIIVRYETHSPCAYLPSIISNSIWYFNLLLLSPMLILLDCGLSLFSARFLLSAFYTYSPVNRTFATSLGPVLYFSFKIEMNLVLTLLFTVIWVKMYVMLWINSHIRLSCISPKSLHWYLVFLQLDTVLAGFNVDS